MANLDLFERMAQAIAKPDTRSAQTLITSPIAPNGIGIALDPDLDSRAKQTLTRLGQEFPAAGLEPEQRAQLNMAAKLSNKAAEDAEFYVGKANSIGGAMARIHSANVAHKGNMMTHDLKVKAADVRHIGQIEHWQSETVSLVEKAREKHAGIQLLHIAL